MKKILLLFVSWLLVQSIKAQSLPPGFSIEFMSSWDTPMGVTFDHSNALYVWERTGRLFKWKSGIKTQLLDLSEEVLAPLAVGGDYGLLSFALDPNFVSNGYVYLYYIVDGNYLFNKELGLNSYNPDENDKPGATIGRITRYTLNGSNGFNSVVSGSRHVILGETLSTGFPVTTIYHGGGELKFALDGSLLLSLGDAGQEFNFIEEAYSAGILNDEEYNITISEQSLEGIWRSQLINSLSGKLIRIDPATGNGISSNPYYDAAEPKAPRSRVWALGLRNAFRMAIRPGTGSYLQEDGNPGILYFGDVGQLDKEEINVVSGPGQNFGWPNYEGYNVFRTHPSFPSISHKGPAIEYGRDSTKAPRLARSGTFIEAGSVDYPHDTFFGKCAIGGTFYEGTLYPLEYWGKYFWADWSEKWIMAADFDSNDELISHSIFSRGISGLITFAYNPNDQCIYFTTNTGSVGKFAYTPTEPPCPSNVTINYSINANGVAVEASNLIIGSGLIGNNANVTLDAGHSVLLTPGFKVESGGVFHAKIGGCN